MAKGGSKVYDDDDDDEYSYDDLVDYKEKESLRH